MNWTLWLFFGPPNTFVTTCTIPNSRLFWTKIWVGYINCRRLKWHAVEKASGWKCEGLEVQRLKLLGLKWHRTKYLTPTRYPRKLISIQNMELSNFGALFVWWVSTRFSSIWLYVVNYAKFISKKCFFFRIFNWRLLLRGVYYSFIIRVVHIFFSLHSSLTNFNLKVGKFLWENWKAWIFSTLVRTESRKSVA